MMKIEGALSQAITGIQRGLSSARDNAAKIANAEGGNPADLIEPMVGLKLDSLQVQASVEVLKAVDEMIGALFDDKA
jgi:hypothetical protein